MPIETMFETREISDEEFKEIDYQIMRIVFDVQNEMGRFWSEHIYRDELAYRCGKAGFNHVQTEAPVKVSYKDFEMNYYIDLLINQSIIYELKAVNALTGEHKNQALNYLFLTGLNHGKLINLRPPLVKSEFVSTKISAEKRFDFAIRDTAWKNLDDDSAWLKQLITDLLFEWGAFLNIHLYYEAINHFRGGEENVIQNIAVVSGERRIGEQKTHLLNEKVAFKISAILNDQFIYEQQLQKFLHFTNLTAIQWINFERDVIIFKTLS